MVIEVNSNGGVYAHGKTFPYEKKAQIAMVYNQMIANNEPVSARSLAKKAGVGKTFANNIISEIKAFGDVVQPPDAKERDIPHGAGSKTLSLIEESVLLQVYYANPKSLLHHYQVALYQKTGTIVSKSTLSAWFRKRFPVKMSFRKTDKVPLDKFKPENILRIHEYHLTINLVLHTPWRLKFGDEKPLKGADLFNGAARKDPFTGTVPATIVDSDFRNTYNIIGFCGIDALIPCAVDYYIIGEGQTTTAGVFMETIKQSIAKGYLHGGDVLILDNASVHRYREASDLRNLLWSYGITLVTLPTRCPELNPIELLWNTLVKRLKTAEITHTNQLNAGTNSRNQVVEWTSAILSSVTHNEIARYYAHCGYMNK